MDSLIGNGSQAALNDTLIRVANVNGTNTLVINGTLPNGTTASGGDVSPSAGTKQIILEHGGYWVMGAIVCWTVFLL